MRAYSRFRFALRRRLAIETLEGRALLAAGDFRLVSYNVAALDGVPSADLGTVLSGIGSEVYAGQVRPIDVLAIQEARTQSTTTATVHVQGLSYGTKSRSSIWRWR